MLFFQDLGNASMSRYHTWRKYFYISFQITITNTIVTSCIYNVPSSNCQKLDLDPILGKHPFIFLFDRHNVFFQYSLA